MKLLNLQEFILESKDTYIKVGNVVYLDGKTEVKITRISVDGRIYYKEGGKPEQWVKRGNLKKEKKLSENKTIDGLDYINESSEDIITVSDVSQITKPNQKYKIESDKIHKQVTIKYEEDDKEYIIRGLSNRDHKNGKSEDFINIKDVGMNGTLTTFKTFNGAKKALEKYLSKFK